MVTGKNNILLMHDAKITAMADFYGIYKGLYFNEDDENCNKFLRYMENEIKVQQKMRKDAESLPEDPAFDDMHPSAQCIYNVLQAYFYCDNGDVLSTSDFRESPLFVTEVVKQVKEKMG